MQPEQREMIDKLRNEGYAVVIWNPDELRGANPSHIEDIVTERGNIAIDDLATEPEEEAHEGDAEIFRCDNCGHEAPYGSLPPAKDLEARIDPGGIYTNVECPECGALCYPVVKPESE